MPANVRTSNPIRAGLTYIKLIWPKHLGQIWDDLIATRSGSSESCDDGILITCMGCGGDPTSMSPCKPSLLVNIAHISKVNDLRALLRPTIASEPSQMRCGAGRLPNVPAKLAGTTGPRCGIGPKATRPQGSRPPAMRRSKNKSTGETGWARP
jgi:hypothetical protein